jgi:hypothetical protein
MNQIAKVLVERASRMRQASMRILLFQKYAVEVVVKQKFDFKLIRYHLEAILRLFDDYFLL